MINKIQVRWKTLLVCIHVKNRDVPANLSTLGSIKLCYGVFKMFLQPAHIRKIYTKNIWIPWWYTVLYVESSVSPTTISLYHVCWHLCVAKYTKCTGVPLDHVMNVPKQAIGEELRISLLQYCPLASSCCDLKYQMHLVNRLLGQLFLADVS